MCISLSRHFQISWDKKMHFVKRYSLLSRGVYSGIFVSLEWVQQREQLCMWPQWNCWQSFTHWTSHHWTLKGMEKDQATARDKWDKTLYSINQINFKTSSPGKGVSAVTFKSVSLSLKVSTWTKQYTAAAHRDIPAMNELSYWLMKNLPAGDNEVTLVHGDFRLDNLIFHPTEVKHLEQSFLQIFSMLKCYKVFLMSLGTCDSSAGLGAVYHWAALGRHCLFSDAPLLAFKPQCHQHNGQLERNRRCK